MDPMCGMKMIMMILECNETTMKKYNNDVEHHTALINLFQDWLGAGEFEKASAFMALLTETEMKTGLVQTKGHGNPFIVEAREQLLRRYNQYCTMKGWVWDIVFNITAKSHIMVVVNVTTWGI